MPQILLLLQQIFPNFGLCSFQNYNQQKIQTFSQMKVKKLKSSELSSEVSEQSFQSESKNKSVSKIIQSYQQLMKSLNSKIQQLTIDLQLTRQKLGITQTRYATLLGITNGSEKVDVQKLIDKIDELQKKLINQNAQLTRCKAKLLKCNISPFSNAGQDLHEKILVQKSNIGNYFNFQSIRQNQSILSRQRKNSAQEQFNSVPWEKALQTFADQTSSPTKFKQKTINILKKFIPHQQRCKVWPFIFENQLGINNSLYIQLMERRAKNPVQSHVKSQIERDIMRSFSSKSDLSNKEALMAEVQEILQIFHLLRPDISYVQGMTYPVIILTIVVGKIQAFKIFSNLILCNKFFRNMYSFEQKSVQVYSKVFEFLLKQSFPDVAKHLQNLKIKPQLFLIEWFFTIFSRGLSLQTTLKIWDMLGYQRQVVLYKICLSIFELIGKRLTTHNYEETVGLIQSYWSYVDQNKLLQLAVNNKLTNEKLSKVFSKITKQVHNINRRKQSQTHSS